MYYTTTSYCVGVPSFIADSSLGQNASLEDQIVGLKRTFVKLKFNVYKLVSNVRLDIFIAGLLDLDFKGEECHDQFLTEITQNKNTVLEIWMKLSPYLHFLNYEILQHILNNFGGDELEGDMKAYTCRIEKFFKSTRLCDFLHFWPVCGETPPVDELFLFVIKHEKYWETCTLHDLDNIHKSVARKIFLPSFAMLLKDANAGCVSVTFGIHCSLMTFVKTSVMKSDLKVFADMDIETITVDGVVCYEAPLLQYTTQLKQLYTSRSPLQPLTDSKLKHLLQFRLAKIEKQTLSQGDMDRFTRESLRGDMDDVVFKKMTMEVSELGVMADGSRPKVVLIEGAPGVGKTTFAWDQCRQWAEGKLLQAYSIVLLLPLRDNNIRQITSLPSLFRHSQRHVREGVSRRVAESEGKGCLIWLEAWDELGNDLRSHSLFTELIRGIQLPAATIYITSRPWATRGLLEQMEDRISQHTELLALATEQVKNEIIHSTGESESGFDFKTYIESNSVIHAAMYTPVSAAIVEQVFKSAPHNPPTTVTGLYSAYVLMRLEQYLTEHPKYSDMKIKVKTLSDLPERVLADFQRLCGLAYEGVSQQMIVFSSLPEGVSTLGLLQSVPQVYEEGEDRVSYNFLHYTVQEYLAALHLSHLQPQEQITIIENKCLRFVTTKYGRDYYEATQFKTTFQFLAGITKLAAYPVEFLSDLLSKDAATMYNHQLPETGISSQLVSFSSHYSRGSITAEGFRHFLTIPNSLLQHIRRLYLHHSMLDRRACDVLAEGVQRMPCLETLDLSDNSRIGCGGAVKLVSYLHSSKLRELDMGDTGISDPDFERLASYIHSTTSLQELSIGWNDISVESIDSLCKALSANSSMRKLNMRSCHLTTSHCVCLGQLLRHPIHCKIEELNLSGCGLTSDGVGEVVSGLSDNHTLRELELSFNQIGSEGAVAIATMLKTNSSLEGLCLDRCSIGSSGGVELGRALERNKTLRELGLYGNALGDDGVRGLSEGLETNSSLEVLRLSGDESLGEEGVSLLLKCVEEKNTSLKRLWLPGKYRSIALRTKGWVSWFHSE